jgi:hypothetical protein
MPIADDFAATVRFLFRFREKETQNFFSAASAPLLFLCADETQLLITKPVRRDRFPTLLLFLPA